MFSCSLVRASTAFVYGNEAGVVNTRASAAFSVPNAPLLIISIISSKPALDLASAVALSAICVSAATCVLATPIAVTVCVF